MSEDKEIAGLIRFVNPDEVKQDLAIDLTDITGDMQKQAGMLFHYASNSVRAKRQYERWKAALDVIDSQLDGKHRTALKEVNPKVTEAQIRAAIASDPEYKAVVSRVINAQEIYRLCEAAERCFDQRKDMLLQIARDAAREQSGPLRVTANQTNAQRAQGLLDLMQQNRESATTTAAE